MVTRFLTPSMVGMEDSRCGCVLLLCGQLIGEGGDGDWRLCVATQYCASATRGDTTLIMHLATNATPGQRRTPRQRCCCGYCDVAESPRDLPAFDGDRLQFLAVAEDGGRFSYGRRSWGFLGGRISWGERWKTGSCIQILERATCNRYITERMTHSCWAHHRDCLVGLVMHLLLIRSSRIL